MEEGSAWPRQLQQWLVVLLRKEDGIPEWNSVRPISVASVVHRIWSRIRTRQLLAQCQTFALPTVGPRLSTRSLCGYVAAFVAEEAHAGKGPSGLVLDIIKAFNVLRRPLVRDVMCHCGVHSSLVQAWLRGLDGMERHLLVAGSVYGADAGHRASTAGVPEGDPLSVVAMYCMCWFFTLWMQASANVMTLTYADNWQALTSQVGPVVEALPFVAQFLEKCALPISQHKCWMWSATAEGRRRMRAARLSDDRIRSNCKPLIWVLTYLTARRGLPPKGTRGSPPGTNVCLGQEVFRVPGGERADLFLQVFVLNVCMVLRLVRSLFRSSRGSALKRGGLLPLLSQG